MKDIQWDGTDIIIADDNDAATVSGHELLEQSIGTLVADELRDVGGRIIHERSLTEITKSIRAAVDRDVDIASVETLQVTEIDRGNNTVTVEAQVAQDQQSEITVNF